MTGPVAAVIEVLDQIIDLLTGEDCPLVPLPCRSSVETGASVAWDTCGEHKCSDGDGQLWASLTSMAVQGASGVGQCLNITWTANIGIVRCAKADLGEDGSFPTVAELRQDVDQQAADADAIRYALNCCEARPDSLRDLALVNWTPLGPSGRCVGGQWTIRGVLDVCC